MAVGAVAASRRMKLRTKASLSVAVLLLVVFGLGLFVHDYLIRTALVGTISAQHGALVSRVAEQVDKRLATNLDALTRSAADITPALLADPEALQRHLLAKRGMLALFDNLIVVGSDLRVRADIPRLAGRVGSDVSGLAHLQRLLEDGVAVISEPVLGRTTGRPTLSMSVPIRNSAGEVVAMLSGTVELRAANFLGLLNRDAYSRGVHFVVVTRAGTTVVGARPEDALQPLAQPMTAALFARALGGWEGTEEILTADGDTMLFGLRRLHNADWILAGFLTTDEAFAPVRESRRIATGLLLATSLLIALLIRWVAVRNFVRPLLDLRERTRRLRNDPATPLEPDERDDEIGEVARAFCEVFGEATRSREESAARAAELQSILDASPVAIIIVRDGCIVRANPAFEQFFGYPLKQVIGHPTRHYYLDDLAYEDAMARIAKGVEGGRVLGYEQIYRHRDGRHVIASVRARLLDPAAPDKGRVYVIEDITEKRDHEARIRHLAEHDALTGLPNRLLMSDRLTVAIEWSRRERKRFALFFIDIDRFKNINDALGHPVGDRLLRELARRLRTAVRDSDTVSRTGGDEFALLTPDIGDPDNAARLAEKLLASLSQPWMLDGRKLVVTASIGIALFPEDGGDVATLLRNADTAMYHSKESGRNAYHFFRAEMNTRVHERMSLESAIRVGLERGEFLLHYQPQIDVREDRVVGAEALLRWNRPGVGLVPPARFVPIAEETGLILQLGEWVLREACRQNRAWQAQGLPPVPVAVNISALQFRQAGFLDVVQDALAQSGLAAGCLELELTESATMHAAERGVEVLGAVRRLGVRVSIDDFGTGYSSLSYLKRLPIDELKIDQAFVRDVVDDADDAAIIDAIIGLACNMKLSVIAEGVESAAQVECLRASGCERFQGYHFSPPLAPDEFAVYWRTRLPSRVGAGLSPIRSTLDD